MKSKKHEAKITKQPSTKYVSQSDVPYCSLTQALKLVHTLADNFACSETSPLQVAQSLNVLPTTTSFRMLCGAAIGYGLTTGGYGAKTISLTELGKRIAKPTVDGDNLIAMKEAALKPRILRDFLKKYDSHKLPKKEIARNVIESMGVPSQKSEKVFYLILNTAEEAKLIFNIKSEKFVQLQEIKNSPIMSASPGDCTHQEAIQHEDNVTFLPNYQIDNDLSTYSQRKSQPNNRVYITHGKNRSFVPSIQDILKFGNFEPIISVERESVSKPVPDKVMDDMRSCGAAIIHVEAEKQISDEDGLEESILNPNVLIEIGAAMALYGKRFILLVQNGVNLPSNLQGLYLVKYDGEKLDADTALKLIKVFNSMKKSENIQKPAYSSSQSDLSINLQQQ